MPVVTDTRREWAIKVFVAAASGRAGLPGPESAVSISLPRWMRSSCDPGPLQACPLMPATVIAERILATRAPKTWRNRRGGGIERDVECQVALLRVNASVMAASMLGPRTMASRVRVIRLCLRHAFGFSARALMRRRQLLAGMDRRAAAVQLPVRVRNTGSVAESSSGIRAAVPGDIGEILKVDHLAARADLERAEYLRQRVRSGECLVHLAGGSVRGFVVLRPAHFFGRDFIDLLMVDAAHRRAGIGRALLKAALSTAGTDQVFTSTNVSNMAMRSLLEDEGWSFSGQLTGLDEGDPELVFYARQAARPRDRYPVNHRLEG